MSLIIKMDSIKSASHLKRAIAYILKESKTQGLSYSNCGFDATEIYDNFQFTKSMYRNSGIREGYHFKLSFSKDETISPEDALAFSKEWARVYLATQSISPSERNITSKSITHANRQNTSLQDPFDFVVAVHTDRDHTHIHLIFNSVSRDGHKYRYEKGHTIKLPDGTDKHIPGDWDTIIKPLTNSLADKYHTGHLREKDPTKDYSPPARWIDVVCRDIDACVAVSSDYKDFKRRMQEDFNYTLREGISRDYGIYLSLTPPGKAKAIRTYRLPDGYQVTDIDQKLMSHCDVPTPNRYIPDSNQPTTDEYEKPISHNTTISSDETYDVSTQDQQELSPAEQKEYRLCFNTKDSWFTAGSIFIPYERLSFYQKAFVRTMLDTRRLYHGTNTSKALTEQSQVAYEAIRGKVRLVCHYHITTEAALDSVIRSLAELCERNHASRQQKSALNELQRIRISSKIREKTHLSHINDKNEKKQHTGTSEAKKPSIHINERNQVNKNDKTI